MPAFAITLTRLLLRSLGYGVVAVLIAAAVLVSLLRLVLPEVDSYRGHVEEVVSGYLGQPVTITALDARLLGLSPKVILKGGTLRDAEARPTLRFEQLELALDPLASVRRGAPVLAELTVVGAHLALERLPSGVLQVQGLTLSEAEAGSGGGVGQWLLGQGRIALRDSTVLWADRVTGRSLRFDHLSVEVRNGAGRHSLSGTARVSEHEGTTVTLAAEVRGDPLATGDWDGGFYLKAETVPHGWLNGMHPALASVDDGRIGFEVWGAWDGAQLRELVGRGQLRDLKVAREGARIGVDRVDGEFRWAREEGGWALSVERLTLVRRGEQRPPARLRLRQRDGGISGTLSRAMVEDLADGVALWGGIDPAQRKLLRSLRPTGTVSELRVEAGDVLHLQAALEDLSIAPSGSLPGISGVDGHLTLSPGRTEIHLESLGASVTLPKLFRAPLSLDRAVGRVLVEQQAQGWRVSSRQLALENRDVALQTSFDLHLPEQGAPFMDLRGEFWNARASRVPAYLPVGIMGEGTVEWLDSAFRSGRAVSGGVVLHGRLSDFPYRDQEGVFKVRFRTQGVELHYAPGWPNLKDIAADVTFDGDGMQIVSHAATLLGGRVGHTAVTIPDFRTARLAVNGSAQLDAADALYLLRETPLREHIGASLADFEAGGATRLNLRLDIPLSEEEAVPQPLGVEGDVTLEGGRIKVAQGVVFEETTGTAHFNGGQLQASKLEARLFGGPAVLAIFSKPGENQPTTIAARGRARGEALGRELALPLVDHLRGEAAWQATLVLDPTEREGTILRVTSELAGMAVDLPHPLGKEAETPTQFNLKYALSGTHSDQLEIVLGDTAAAFDFSEGALQRGAVQFGGGTPALPERALLRITGALEGLAPGAWGGFFAQRTSLGEGVPIELRMERLHLLAEEPGGAGGRAPAPWPQLDVAIGDFAYGTARLGEVRFRSRDEGRATLFEGIEVRAPALAVVGEGRWAKEGAGTTRFDLTLTADDIGRMAEAVGLVSVVRKGKTRAAGYLQWEGTPLDIAFESLSGKLRVEVEKGVIEDVEPGAGRLLGLLSLRALPRRLFLDFSDLLGQGMTFSSIRGDLTIDQGTLSTQNLLMDSPSAGVLVSGETGLADRSYNQLVSVVPNVSDTIPVAGGLAWGPQVAAVLLLVHRLFRSEIDKAAMFQYKVTGSWDAPVVVRLSSDPG